MNSLYKKISSDNNNLLLWIVNDLQQIVSYTKENIMKEQENNEGISLDEEESQSEEFQCLSENREDKTIEKPQNTQFRIKFGKENKILLERRTEKEENEDLNFFSDNKKIKKRNEYHYPKDLLKIKEKYYKKRDQEIINRIENLIKKLIYVYNDNKKNSELIINNFSFFQKKLEEMNKKFKEEENNNLTYQTKRYQDGNYIGNVLNGEREGEGIMFYNNGESFVGHWKNDLQDGKGIYYYKNGDKYDGDWTNGKKEGKGIYSCYHNKNIYEGDWKNDKREGRGIIYYKNGDREMGDFVNDLKKGKFVILTNNGKIYSKDFE